MMESSSLDFPAEHVPRQPTAQAAPWQEYLAGIYYARKYAAQEKRQFLDVLQQNTCMLHQSLTRCSQYQRAMASIEHYQSGIPKSYKLETNCPISARLIARLINVPYGQCFELASIPAQDLYVLHAVKGHMRRETENEIKMVRRQGKTAQDAWQSIRQKWRQSKQVIKKGKPLFFTHDSGAANKFIADKAGCTFLLLHIPRSHKTTFC